MPGVSSSFAQNSASRGPSSKTIKITFLTIYMYLRTTGGALHVYG